MRILLQRCKNASVVIDEKEHTSIKQGLVLFVGIEEQDTLEDVDALVKKIVNLRIFADEQGKINLSILDTKQEVLSISQYSLYAAYKKGNRPSFLRNAPVEKAKQFYELFNKKLSEHINVKTGVFQADMQVHLINDGPFTMMLDTEDLRKS